MSSPWQQPNQPTPRPPRGGGGLWLVIALAAAGGLIWFLAPRLSASLHTSDDFVHLAYLVGLLLLVSSGFTYFRGRSLSTNMKYISGWGAIVLIIMTGYAFREDFQVIARRIGGELTPATGVQTGEREVRFTLHQSGHFFLDGKVNGRPLPFMLDTGATNIVLTQRAARHVGIDPDRLLYNLPTSTANGRSYSAAIRLEELRIGPIVMRDIPATVTQGDLDVPLLGMDFLRRLRSYEVSGPHLTLRW